MHFILIPPSEPQIIFGTASTIFADGEIEDGDADRFARLLAVNDVKENSTIYLNSEGGSLHGGMALGRAIRTAGLFSFIGRHSGLLEDGALKAHSYLPGDCYSAATLAFLGGQYRWIGEGCAYGVHRFYAEEQIGDDHTQITAAMILDYLREMGVDAALFSEMAKAGRAEINELTHEQLVELRVVNGPLQPARWSVESDGEDLYLKGERTSWRGVDKFILEQHADHIALLAIFDPEGRGTEATELGAHSLMINGVPHPIEPLTTPKLEDGLVVAHFPLTSEHLANIASATTVGIAFQFFHGHPLFLGFDGLETKGGEGLIKGFLRRLAGRI